VAHFDVGGCTSFSLHLETLGESYKVWSTKGNQLDPLHGLYLMTQVQHLGLGLKADGAT